MPRRLGLATYHLLPRLGDDDRLLLDPLRRRGVVAEPVVWDAPAVRWGEYDAVLVRSCWNYHLRPEAFLQWITSLEAAPTPLWNAPSILRWNLDKRYLRDLVAHGVPCVPTRWVDPDADLSLAHHLEETGWEEVVVKPTISASAYGTWRTSRARAEQDEVRFRILGRQGHLMLQPFLPQIATQGEWSLVFLRARYSHAVLKLPGPGDFRVQRHHGGTAEAAEVSEEVIEIAERSLRLVPGEPLYARVDGCDIDGQFHVMEIEVLEPSLFLGTQASAADRLAEAIVDFLDWMAASR